MRRNLGIIPLFLISCCLRVADASEPQNKVWQSVSLVDNEVLSVKLRYMTVSSLADRHWMALEFDNRSSAPLKVGQISITCMGIGIRGDTILVRILTNGITTVTGGPLTAALPLPSKEGVRVEATASGDVRLQDNRKFHFDKVPFIFERRYPNPAEFESMKRELREILHSDPRTSSLRQGARIRLSDGTEAVIELRNQFEGIYRLRPLLGVKEVSEAMTVEDLLAALKTWVISRHIIAKEVAQRFPKAPQVLAYYREELAKENNNAWSDALILEVWNGEFLKVFVERYEQGKRWPDFSTLERHRKEWIGKPDCVARISAGLLKQHPILKATPEQLLKHELHEWSRAVRYAGATGDRQFIKFLAPALNDTRLVKEPEYSSMISLPTRVCDYALSAIQTILDGDSTSASKKAVIAGWSSGSERFAAFDRAITETKKRLEASGLAQGLTSAEAQAKNYDGVNTRDQRGRTSLGVAAANLKVESVKELIAARSDVNAQDPEGESPLLMAIRNPDRGFSRFGSKDGQKAVEIAKLLLEAGANPSSKNAEGTTALMLAVEWRIPEIVTELLNRKADVNAVDKRGRTALTISVGRSLSRPSSKTVESLLAAGADVNFRNGEKSTPLILACQNGDKALAQMLLDKGAKVKDVDGDWALYHALGHSKIDVMRVLLERGASPNAAARNETGKTVFMRACQGRKTEPIALLLEFGADVNFKQGGASAGFTALIWAAGAKNNATVIKFLLSKGADVNAQTERFGDTALIRAAANGYNENVQALLDGHADFKLKNKDGRTALMWARKNNHPDTAALLEKAGARE